MLLVVDQCRIKKVSIPIESAPTMDRNFCQNSGRSSRVGIAGHMGQNPQGHSGTKDYGDGI